MRLSSRRRGQSLVEIMVVIAIIGILTTVTAVGVMEFLGNAKVDATKITLSNVDKVLLAYTARHGHPPTTAEGLQAVATFFPEHLVPTDTWDHPLLYQSPGPDGHDYEVRSLGADGLEGGTGNDADLSNIRGR